MKCVQKEIYDCSKQPCQSGYECCKQHGNNFGLCIKEGQCNRKTGLPNKSCREAPSESYIESFNVSSLEGFTSDKKVYIPAIIGGCVVVAIIIALVLKKKK